MATRSALVNAMATATVKATRALARDFGEIENLLASRRGARSYAARTHDRIGEALTHHLSRARPDYAMPPPDGAGDGGDSAGPAWVVAPLDGAANLARAAPHAAAAVGAREGGRIVAAVVYDPLRNELYWAEKGVGAYVDRRRIRCAAPGDTGSAMVALSPLRGVSPARLAAAAGPAELRIFGAPALDLAWVASGRLHGFAGAAPAAVRAICGLLLREAGAMTETLQPDGAQEPLFLVAQARFLAVLSVRAQGLTAAARGYRSRDGRARTPGLAAPAREALGMAKR